MRIAVLTLSPASHIGSFSEAPPLLALGTRACDTAGGRRMYLPATASSQIWRCLVKVDLLCSPRWRKH